MVILASRGRPPVGSRKFRTSKFRGDPEKKQKPNLDWAKQTRPDQIRTGLCFMQSQPPRLAKTPDPRKYGLGSFRWAYVLFVAIKQASTQTLCGLSGYFSMSVVVRLVRLKAVPLKNRRSAETATAVRKAEMDQLIMSCMMKCLFASIQVYPSTRRPVVSLQGV